MKLNEIKKAVAGESYEFLRSNAHLGSHIILLGLGGSHAYGTETDSSDLDVRGCAIRSKREILCGEDFEQVTNSVTDTTIYSFKKLIHLLTECNPNTIEILGLQGKTGVCQRTYRSARSAGLQGYQGVCNVSQ